MISEKHEHIFYISEQSVISKYNSLFDMDFLTIFIFFTEYFLTKKKIDFILSFYPKATSNIIIIKSIVPSILILKALNQINNTRVLFNNNITRITI